MRASPGSAGRLGTFRREALLGPDQGFWPPKREAFPALKVNLEIRGVCGRCAAAARPRSGRQKPPKNPPTPPPKPGGMRGGGPQAGVKRASAFAGFASLLRESNSTAGHPFQRPKSCSEPQKCPSTQSPQTPRRPRGGSHGRPVRGPAGSAGSRGRFGRTPFSEARIPVPGPKSDPRRKVPERPADPGEALTGGP